MYPAREVNSALARDGQSDYTDVSGVLRADLGILPMLSRDDFDPLAPQREAAMFYGLFLRGHSADALRKDIDIPRDVVEKWSKRTREENNFRDNLRRVYEYRKQVLAIFDELVLNEKNRARLQ